MHKHAHLHARTCRNTRTPHKLNIKRQDFQLQSILTHLTPPCTHTYAHTHIQKHTSVPQSMCAHRCERRTSAHVIVCTCVNAERAARSSPPLPSLHLSTSPSSPSHSFFILYPYTGGAGLGYAARSAQRRGQWRGRGSGALWPLLSALLLLPLLHLLLAMLMMLLHAQVAVSR